MSNGGTNAHYFTITGHYGGYYITTGTTFSENYKTTPTATPVIHTELKHYGDDVAFICDDGTRILLWVTRAVISQDGDVCVCFAKGDTVKLSGDEGVRFIKFFREYLGIKREWVEI
jgi:hypothetical protein